MLVSTDHDTFVNVLFGIDQVLCVEDRTFVLKFGEGTTRQRAWLSDDGDLIACVIEHPYGEKTYRIQQSLQDQLERT